LGGGGKMHSLLEKLPLSLPSSYYLSILNCEVQFIRVTEEKKDAWNDAVRLGVIRDLIFLKKVKLGTLNMQVVVGLLEDNN